MHSRHFGDISRKKGFQNFSRNPTCKTRGYRCNFFVQPRIIIPACASRVSLGNSIVQSRRPLCISACCCLCSCAPPPNSPCQREIVAAPAGILICREFAAFRCLPISREVKLLERTNVDETHSSNFFSCYFRRNFDRRTMISPRSNVETCFD